MGSEIELYYYRARYYDPKIGRFISEDPIGLKGGPNRYGYVENTPPNRRDPRGTESMNPTEMKWCFTNTKNLAACGMAAPCMFEAEMITFIAFGTDDDDGPANAYKHCWWACCIAKKVGAANAFMMTDNHEANQRQDNPCSSQMDAHNNGIGIAMGVANSKSCDEICNKAVLCTDKPNPPCGGGVL